MMKSGISILILICLQLATNPLCLCGTAAEDETAIASCCLHAAPVGEEPGRDGQCPDCPHCDEAGSFVSNSPGTVFLPPGALSLDSIAAAPRILSIALPLSGISTQAIEPARTILPGGLLENRAFFGVFLI